MHQSDPYRAHKGQPGEVAPFHAEQGGLQNEQARAQAEPRGQIAPEDQAPGSCVCIAQDEMNKRARRAPARRSQHNQNHAKDSRECRVSSHRSSHRVRILSRLVRAYGALDP